METDQPLPQSKRRKLATDVDQQDQPQDEPPGIDEHKPAEVPRKESPVPTDTSVEDVTENLNRLSAGPKDTSDNSSVSGMDEKDINC